MQYSVFIVTALAGLSAALTPANTANPPEGNAITSPLNQVVPAGKPFTIKWTPSTTGKVSLLLLKGDSQHAVPIQTIVDSIDNTGSYTWTPDASLAPTDGPTGYGIELVVEGTGQYQYSTQIGIGKADGSSAASSSSAGGIETAPPAGQTQATAEGGALAEITETKTGTTTVPCTSTTAAPLTTAPVASGAPAAPAATGTSNYTSPVLSPTNGMSKPTSLSTVAVPSGSAAPAGTTGGVSAGAATGNSAQLTGAFAAVVGLVSYLVL